MYKLSPRRAAVRIVHALRDAGHTAYLAGGCVRDSLLGLEPKDFDVATDAKPLLVRKIFPRSRFVGESFGVVLVYVGRRAIEVATFRREWDYRDGRRPNNVIFTDAEHDAQRRDFTINGLFADPLDTPDIDDNGASDRIIDFVDGRADLKAGIIRAIGNPYERFGEDYLRMLRAVRFAARLNFKIEPQTTDAIRVLSARLNRTSRERIGQELFAMLRQPSKQAAQALALLQQVGLDAPVLNEACIVTLPKTVSRLADDVAYGTTLAAWMIDRHASQPPLNFLMLSNFVEQQAGPLIHRWREALCLSNEDRNTLEQVLKRCAEASQWSSFPVAARKRLLATTQWNQALLVLNALKLGQPLEQLEREAQALKNEGISPDPWIDGHDLLELGYKPGPKLGRILEQAYDAQLEGVVASRDEALAWAKRQLAMDQKD